MWQNTETLVSVKLRSECFVTTEPASSKSTVLLWAFPMGKEVQNLSYFSTKLIRGEDEQADELKKRNKTVLRMFNPIQTQCKA